MNTDDTNDGADFAVLDMALAEELGRAAPPELWPRLAAKGERRTRARAWLVAALVLIGVAVVAAVSVLSREPEAAGAAQPGRVDVDPKGPATLPELQARLASARHATVTAEAIWSHELGRFVPIVHWGNMERMLRPKLRPELDPDEFDAVCAALRTATAGALLRDVAWTHTIAVPGTADGASVLVQRRAGAAPTFAFASPRGAIALDVPAFPFALLNEQLDAVAQQTQATLGVVIGANGFASVAADASSLRLHGVPATATRELARFTRAETIDLADAPDWHATDVLREVARLPVRSLVLDPRQLAGDAYPLLGSIASVRELAFVAGSWVDAYFGPWRGEPAAGLDDAAILALRGLSQMTELTIAGGVFGDDALRALGPLPALRRLALIGCNRLGGDSLAAFSSVTNLALIDCSGLREDFLGHVAAMPQVKDVWIRNPGCHVHVQALRGAPNLSELAVQGRISPDELRLLAECAMLKKLTLWLDPPLRDEDLIWLHGLRQLRQLYIGGDAVTAAGRAALRAALPSCRISDEQW